ncbi:MAG: FAD:protein FMN transferase [Hyphomicrobiales bacterium]
MIETKLSKRRFLTIFVAATSAALMPSKMARASTLTSWKGTALGADASLLFQGLSKPQERKLVGHVLAEVERLEQIFSLYIPSSELCRLNREGMLENPSHDMQVLLSQALWFWRQTDSAFNPAIQPLWLMLKEHFANSPGSKGPDAGLIASALHLCKPENIEIRGGRIVMRPGMALTFNGIAQGYITDRVVEILRSEGLRHVLVDLGEMRALPGRPWQVGLGGARAQATLAGRALATSAPAGMRLSKNSNWHHLVDPGTGKCPAHVRQVSVLSDEAMTADALSTALAVSGPAGWERIARRFPHVSIHLETAEGRFFKTGQFD